MYKPKPNGVDYKTWLEFWLKCLRGGFNPVDMSPLVGYHPDMASMTFHIVGTTYERDNL